MFRLLLFFLIFIYPLYSLTMEIDEYQTIILEDERVIIEVNGTLNLYNITSEIYDIFLEEKNLFPIELNYEANNSVSQYFISTVLPYSEYNNFLLEGISFLEFTTHLNIQTNRYVSLTKYERDSNLTYAPRNIRVDIINPTNYSQLYIINLIKTRPNQVSEFRDKSYLKSQKKLTILPNSSDYFLYKDQLSEVGDSYFVEYDVMTLPLVLRNISKSISKDYTRPGGKSSFTTFLKELQISKTITPFNFGRGDIVKVILKISNPNGFSLDAISLKDEIPSSFFYVNNPDIEEFTQELNFLPFETKEIVYYLEFIGEDEIIVIPSAIIEQGSQKISSNIITVFPNSTYTPKIIIEKIISPISDEKYSTIILIKNIDRYKSGSFMLEENSKTYYIPELNPQESYIIEYDGEEVSFEMPIISKEINATVSLIINDEISSQYSPQSKQPYYTLGLIILAGILLFSDIIL